MRDTHMNAFCFDGRVRVSTLPLGPMVLARGIVRFALLFLHLDDKLDKIDFLKHSIQALALRKELGLRCTVHE